MEIKVVFEVHRRVRVFDDSDARDLGQWSGVSGYVREQLLLVEEDGGVALLKRLARLDAEQTTVHLLVDHADREMTLLENPQAEAEGIRGKGSGCCRNYEIFVLFSSVGLSRAKMLTVVIQVLFDRLEIEFEETVSTLSYYRRGKPLLEVRITIVGSIKL